MDWAPQAVREGIFTILFISGPLVVLAATLGLTIGVIQAATQVQEQTLGSAVKIIGLFIALIVFGFFMFSYMRNYTKQSVERAFKLIPSLGSYVKPRDNFLQRPTAEEEKVVPRPPVKELPSEDASAPSKSSKLAGDLIKQPDEEPVGGNTQPERLAPPPSQVKIEDKNIKKQKFEGIAQQPLKPASPSVVVKPLPSPPVQKAKPAPAAVKAPTQVSAPEPTPIRGNAAKRASKRKSLSDSISRLRNQVGGN